MPITRRHLLQLAAAATASAGPTPAIKKIEVFPTPYPVGARFKFLPKPERPSVLVKITAEDGAAGWGQSVPVPTWSYET
ncbi:MAG: twin-arginine translocation signal domain-containing protein, partial [Bryobacteraceae bacterium]|nr:twin-arginine translocation signal domain-containing protein [Bryobacteraceae bacterium]